MNKATEYLDKLVADATERQRIQSNYERACADAWNNVLYNIVSKPPTTAEEMVKAIVDMGRQNYGVHKLIAGDGIHCPCHGECTVCQLTTSEKDRAGNWCHSYHPQYQEQEEAQS